MGSIVYKFYRKLLYVKGKFKHWNAHVFKNIFQQKEVISKQLAVINEKFTSQGLTPHSYEKHKKLQNE